LAVAAKGRPYSTAQIEIESAIRVILASERADQLTSHTVDGDAIGRVADHRRLGRVVDRSPLIHDHPSAGCGPGLETPTPLSDRYDQLHPTEALGAGAYLFKNGYEIRGGARSY
jgi:hypothetical protein